ncbi:NUDIX hydrolase [Glycomyces tarimensis]
MSAEHQTTTVRRRCARVLLVDEDGRLLLFYSNGFVAPGVEYYVTVGGGVEDGETLAEAAAREAFEETGLRLDPAELGPVVAHAEGLWSDGPELVTHNDESYFYRRVPHFEPVRDRLEAIEREELNESRWLTVDEVEAADDRIFPAHVAELLKGLNAGVHPQAPVELAWGAWCWDAKWGWTATERPGILGQ